MGGECESNKAFRAAGLRCTVILRRSAGLCSLCMLFVAVATPSWAWLGRHEAARATSDSLPFKGSVLKC